MFIKTGADLVEHKIRHTSIGISRALSALVPGNADLEEFTGIPQVGQNPGHMSILNDMRIVSFCLFLATTIKQEIFFNLII